MGNASGIRYPFNAVSPETAQNFIRSARNGDKAAVMKYLTRYGDAVIVDKQEGHGTTALMAAAAGGQKDIVELLLDRGAGIHKKDYMGDTALMAAADNGCTEVAELLLERGAVLEEKSKAERTALSCAAEKGKTDTAAFLIKKGADIETKSKHGKTPLMWAAQGGHVDTLKLLLEQGANIEATDDRNLTAMDYALNYTRLEAIEIFKRWNEELRQREIVRQHAQMLDDTNFQRGLKKPMARPRPIKIFRRK
jgi:ankyrin repeat protein